jgi:hypothetical protein
VSFHYIIIIIKEWGEGLVEGGWYEREEGYSQKPKMDQFNQDNMSEQVSLSHGYTHTHTHAHTEEN